MCYLQVVVGDRVVTHGLPWEILYTEALRRKPSFLYGVCWGGEMNAKKAGIICCFIGLNYHPVSTETKTLSHEQIYLCT